MIAAIMQPYFFPYIGYFQLMKAVDLFVIYDDAQYMKGGWINRNRILRDGEVSWLTLPVKRESLSLSISQRSYLLDDGVVSIKNKLFAAYARAPAFAEAYPLLCKLLDFHDPNVATFNANLLRVLAQELDIHCDFAMSSKIGNHPELHGEAKVIDLCKVLGVHHYINAIGGINLYDPAHFSEAGLQLSFLRTTCNQTRHSVGEAHLSIIDTIMRAGREGCKLQLDQYEILDNAQAPTAV